MKPVYIKIHDEIKQEIENETWPIGTRLPSERALSERFHVSRMTLRQAVTALVDEGILERRAGSGTYVSSQRVRERMRGTTSFTEIIQSQGKQPRSEVLAYTKTAANEIEVEKLNLKSGAQIIRMERIRYADDVPICYEVASIPYLLISDFDRQDVANHFFKTLVASGREIGRSEQVISSKIANGKIADYLKMKKGQAILSLTQTSYFTDDTPFEFVLSQYAGDRFEFFLER
ncbi:GntR family transcriptional regulator [Floricoccus tropicus]|uniref:GntR family transcriptional regulator n=1 Tax=Floricoccus tropicus TaxID=1859473 RepID=A0A1E8GNT8_9LACT|nr:GntR family transcriptional regulator [Floricoccus tropicus]OFI49930.1 GntR family transcriptional regulator [Floricoccus tropicus]